MTNTDKQVELEKMRHSFAHVLAMAVIRVCNDAKLGIGPVVDDGFYHDFEFSKPIGSKDLEKIEIEINKIIEEEIPFQQVLIPKTQAFDILHLQGQIYKTEILNSIPDAEVSFYKTGKEFMDLCRGPHVDHTGKLGAFKLTGISGTHWNSDVTRPEMQRIHGIAFETKKELEEFVKLEEEKKSKDHKKLGKQLELFIFDKDNGAGLPLWLPKGEAIKRKILDYVYKQNLKYGYKYVETPIISKESVFKKLSSTNHFPPMLVEKDNYIAQPSWTEHHIQIFSSVKRSYRSLPFRLSENTTIFKNEQSGELNGLLRVRNLKVDANTIICSKEQVSNEITKSLKLIKEVYNDFEMKDFRLEVAMRGNDDEYYEGNPKDWIKAETLLMEGVKATGLTAHEAPNTADKHGPGLIFKFKDAYNKSWKLGFLVIDIKGPKTYNLEYIDNNNKSKIPYLIYRSTLGSIERFFGIMLEHTDGTFPVWLSPVQINIIPISEKFVDYAKQLQNLLIDTELSVQVDSAPETMQNKIRESQSNMIPYMLIVGEKEQQTNTVSVRPRSGQDLGMMKIEEFVSKIKVEIENKVNF